MNPEALWVAVYNYRDASGERVYSSADVAFFANLSKNLTRFYRAMLCIRGTSHGPVSVRPSVRTESKC